MTSSSIQGFRGLTLISIGVLGAPIVWALHLLVSYGLVAVACMMGGVLLLHIVTLISLALAFASGVAAWRFRAAAKANPASDGAGVSLDRFLWQLGLANSALFFAVIIVQGLPNFFLSPCLF